MLTSGVSPVASTDAGPAGTIAIDILLVDDRAENLLALEAILEPLGERLVRAHSGDEALRHLLRSEFACILPERASLTVPVISGLDSILSIALSFTMPPLAAGIDSQ